MMPRLDKMLHGDINQNQRPSYTKPVAVLRPVRRNTRGHMVQQVHIREQKDVISYAVSAVEVDVKRAEHPYLDNRERAKAALTELFQSIKNPETPIIVENVVNDIDQKVVSIVRNFNDVFQTVSGKKEVQRQLRSILWLKYKIKDQEVFDKAYSYIEMYY